MTDPAVPESAETLAIHRQELIDGTRHVMAYKGGLGPQPPQGFGSTRVGRDTYHFNEDVHSPDTIRAAIANDTIGQHLRLGETTKNEAMASGEPWVATVERTPEGHEVRAAAGTPTTAPSQMDHFKRTMTKGNSVGVETPGNVISKRIGRRDDGDHEYR